MKLSPLFNLKLSLNLLKIIQNNCNNSHFHIHSILSKCPIVVQDPALLIPTPVKEINEREIARFTYQTSIEK